MAIFYAPRGVDRKKISPLVVKWMDENLEDFDHVFVEFEVPEGRQLDFLVLRPNGAYCIEVKNVPYIKAVVNGPWIYQDGRTGSSISDHNESGENPYQQATNEANSLRKWLSKREVRTRVFESRADQIKIDDKHHVIEPLKVQAAVLIPANQTSLEYEENWCILCNGTDQIPALFEKRHWKSGFTLSTNEIQRIADILQLERVSILNLVDLSESGLPPAIGGYEAYCKNLVAYLNSLDKLLDFYIPHRMNEIRQPTTESPGQVTKDINSQLRTTTDLPSALKPGARFLIEADGGIGKTTLCLNLCREAALKKLKDSTAPLPIYLELKYYLPDQQGFIGLVSSALTLLGMDARHEISSVLEKANLLLFLDGLNEIEEAAWPRFLAECRRLISTMSRSAVLITGRLTHRQPFSVPGLFVYRISSFSDHQLRDYLVKRGHPDLISGITLDEINNLLQIPLMASLAVQIGKSFKIVMGLREGSFYRVLCREFLIREAAKTNRTSGYQILWDDLVDLARKISEGWPSNKGEIPKTKAIEIIRERRFEPAIQKVALDLELLIASQLVREHPQSGNISFSHDSIRSFFYAVWLFEVAPEEDLYRFVAEKTGGYKLFLNMPDWAGAYLLDKSALFEKVLQFLFSFAVDGQSATRRDILLDWFFTHDPLFAASCIHYIDHDEFLTRMRTALGLIENGVSRLNSSYPFFEECIAIFVQTVDKGSVKDSWTQLENTGAAGLIAEEIAVRSVIKGNISELAPLLLERLCRSMKRSSLPYSNILPFPAWAHSRFDDLMKLCSPPELANIFRRIIHNGSLEESRNAVIVLNYLVLRSFSKNMGIDVIYINKEINDENGEYYDYENVDSRWAFDDLISRIHLIQEFTTVSIDAMAARELEFELRLFSLFEALFVLDPLVYTLVNGDSEKKDEAFIISTLDECITLIHQDNFFAHRLARMVLMGWFNGAWNTDSFGPECAHSDVELVRWGLFDLTSRNNEIALRLIRLLDDPTQSIEAAHGIVRLYFDGLWTRKERLKKRLPERTRDCTHFSETRSDGTYEMKEWSYRLLGEFLNLLPHKPTEFIQADERELVKLELFVSGNTQFSRAAHILLDYWNESL